MTSPEHQRVLSFLRWANERTSSRVVPTGHGTAYLREDAPLRFDSNFLWAEGLSDGVTAEELAAEADQVLAGLKHRQIHVADRAAGERLAPGLVSMGYEATPLVAMAHRREPDRPGDALVEEVSAREMRAADEVFIRREPYGSDEETVRQLADFRLILPEVLGTRFFVAKVDGQIASGADLYLDGETALIDAVVTLEEHRGRGLARSVVLRMIDEARRSGCDLVFLHADENDWPQHMYAKLGFDPIGYEYDFLRDPSRS